MKLELNMLQTTALAVIMYYIGLWIKNKVTMFEKFCIPAPVIGGLIFALINLLLRQLNIATISLDTTLQTPFMLAFFTTIGLNASFKMIKQGGKQVFFFFVASISLVIFQNVIAIFLSKFIGIHPLLGILSGSITMTGGHGTGLIWGQSLESTYGLAGASTTAMASATFGLICGSLIGGPIAKRLIRKHNLNQEGFQFVATTSTDDNTLTQKSLFNTLSLIFICMGLGSILESIFTKIGIILPSYIDSMIVAAIILNIGEVTNKFKINTKCTETIGNISLNIFLSMALINLQLWQLKDTAGPLLILLIGQGLLMALFSYFITFKLMGKNYDAAVMSAGHCGFGMGATPNGMANMEAITSKFGPSQKAFFILPIVGAFLVDFTNSIVITFFVNFFS